MTALSVRLLAQPSATTVAILGCGTLARAHLELLNEFERPIDTVVLYDIVPAAAHDLAEYLASVWPGLVTRIVETAEQCVRVGTIVITTTTVTEGYIPFEWLNPGTLVT